MNKLFTSIILILVGAVAPLACVVMGIRFDQQCAGYLKQTADANTVELAIDRIDKAISYLEANDLTSGYTSVLWKTEDENIGYWYENIKACRDELESCLDGTQLERSNVLMKVRESLTDEGEKGTKLTMPKGISLYPHNAILGILRGISYFILCIGFALLFMYLDEL